MNEAFKDKITAKFIDAKSKKLANIIFEGPDDAKNAEKIITSLITSLGSQLFRFGNIKLLVYF